MVAADAALKVVVVRNNKGAQFEFLQTFLCQVTNNHIISAMVTVPATEFDVQVVTHFLDGFLRTVENNSSVGFGAVGDEALDQFNQPVACLKPGFGLLEVGLQMVEGKKNIVTVKEQQAIQVAMQQTWEGKPVVR